MTLPDFYRLYVNELQFIEPCTANPNTIGNALGLLGKFDVLPATLSPYSIACSAFRLRHYDYFAKELDITADKARAQSMDYTDYCMTSLTQLPNPLVFFVPPNLRSHEHAHWTASEMNWTLGNPERIGNMLFVFGLSAFVVEHGIQEPGDTAFCAQLLIDALSS